MTILLNTTEQHVHFIGIGGYGMSAIARVMLEMGYTVTGSDVAAQELTEKLAAKGAKIYIGHTAEQVHGADLVVYSTALPQDNVERVEAQEQGIPILHRSQMLARLLNERSGIAVAGTHGKTTTSSMIALVMESCGADPTYIIGGELMDVGTNAKAGQGKFVVAEADESDGSFLQYHPWIGVVTNIEADHLENYGGDFGRLKEAYVQFLNQIKPGGRAVVCGDDRNVQELMPSLSCGMITYGIETDCDYSAHDIELGDRCVTFKMRRGSEELGTVELSVPGRHNAYNAMATIIVCLEAGIPFADITEALQKFHGAKRRFQVLGEMDGILIIDDYAHHPTEIQATIAAAKATGKRIIAVFQPQRYTRTFFLLDAFSRALATRMK
ncbi:UDP-N-acetylmuramate--L-alanine ligase [Paenibacillus macerans]|nr:UDP-N-acetylmuramate--L-alanine ligase [Paenibacillus macerans]